MRIYPFVMSFKKNRFRGLTVPKTGVKIRRCVKRHFSVRTFIEVSMKEWTISGSKVVGLKQTLRAVLSHDALTVYLAMNADECIRIEVEKNCQAEGVEVVRIETMRELGHACGIDREASTAAVLKG